MRKEKIGKATLYLGDSEEILIDLPKMEALITDPPYGIGMDGVRESTGSHGGRKAYDFLGWDEMAPSKEMFDLMIAKAEKHCIWGANYFTQSLPPTMKWLVWDKGQRIAQSDGELAWTSSNKALRIFTMNRVQLMLDGAVHPTQKPIKLMEWCIQQIEAKEMVFDPYMGSGSTGVATVKNGLNFIGIEHEEKYFNLACERIENAQRQVELFV